MEYFIQLLILGIMIGAVYALIAMGFSLIYRATGILNIAQGGFVMLGAYICFELAAQHGVPFGLAFIVTAVVSLGLGMLVDRVLLHPMIGQPVLGIVMMTIGLLIIIEAIVVPLWGADFHSYPSVLPTHPIRLFGDVVLSYEYLVGFVIAIILLISISALLRFSRLGVHLRAVGDDTQAAEAAGIRVRRIFSLAWGLGIMVSATGGIVLGMIMTVYPGLSFMGLKAMPAVIVGGMESIVGAMVGGLIVGILEYVFGSYMETFFGLQAFRDVFPFIILLLFLLVKPYGLFGWRRIERI